MDLIIPIIQILVAFQCFSFSGFLVFDHRLALTANRVLLIILLVFGIHMSVNVINQYFLIGVFPDFAIGLGYAYGPLIYLYTQSLTLQNFQLSKQQLWHFLPGFAVIASAMVTPFSTLIYAYGIFISLFVYFLLSRQTLKKYQIILGQTRSNYEQVALNWLSRLLTLQIVLLIINVVSVQFYIMGMQVFGFWSEVGLFLALLILINTIIFNGLMHPELFAGISLEDQNLVNQTKADNIPALSSKEAKALLKIIDAHMEKKQPFLNPSLTIRQVGLQLITNPRHVSQAINSEKAINFSEYVNTFRIELVKEILASSKAADMSILDIMLDCGFNTKSNFNRSFKSVTDMTPLQYRRLHNPNHND